MNLVSSGCLSILKCVGYCFVQKTQPSYVVLATYGVKYGYSDTMHLITWYIF